MQPPAPTTNEEERLSALEALNILDTPPEERFDRITRLVRGSFQVPIALVSLIDENRQWFKSCFGLNVRQTDRDISFCGHAINTDDVFIIEDTLADPRFSDNPLVTSSPFIRFYAGVPLRAKEGYKIGTLCLIDRQRRSLSDFEIDRLKELARLVEHELLTVHSQTMDAQTQVSNKKGLLELAHFSIETSREHQVPLTLALLTIKPQSSRQVEGTLKAINCVADTFKTRLREVDVLARPSANLFAILLPNCEPEEANVILGAYLDAVYEQLQQQEVDDYIDIQFSSEALNPDDPAVMARLEAL